jgi:UDP-galactose transporter B1
MSTMKLYTLAVGVWVSFVAFGWAQETLTSHKFGEKGERFEHTSALVLLQSVGNAVVAYIALVMQHGPRVSVTGGVPTKDWLIAALGYLGAHKAGLEALKFIIFPLQVVVKSCKSIPVMAGEMLIANVKHSPAKRMSVFVMTMGVIAFTLLAPSKAGSQAFQLDRKTVIGLSLVFVALVCDGIYGPYQSKIAKEYKVSEFHLMLNMNLWQGLFSFLLIAPSGARARRRRPTVCARAPRATAAV